MTAVWQLGKELQLFKKIASTFYRWLKYNVLLPHPQQYSAPLPCCNSCLFLQSETKAEHCLFRSFALLIPISNILHLGYSSYMHQESFKTRFSENLEWKKCRHWWLKNHWKDQLTKWLSNTFMFHWVLFHSNSCFFQIHWTPSHFLLLCTAFVPLSLELAVLSLCVVTVN